MTTQVSGLAGWRIRGCRFLLGLGLVLAGFTLRGAEDVKFDVIETESRTYTNVTVLNKTRTDIFIQHAGGVANLKLKDLDDKILTQLGYQVAPKKQPMKPLAVPTQILTNVTQQLEAYPQFQALRQKWQTELQPKLPPISKGLILGVLAGVLFCHLLGCYCCLLIVRKVGQKPGLLVWIPGLQMIPMLRAAGMSGWCFLLLLVPVVNLVVSVMWCFKIVECRGKGVIWAILLLLPITNFFAFLYLAFSGTGEPQLFRASPPPLAKAA
jgi:hypothetical protein